jgi:hypothetical protein
MMIWQPKMKNKTNNSNNNHKNNRGWLYINNNSNEESVLTCGRTVQWRFDVIEFTNYLAHTDE